MCHIRSTAACRVLVHLKSCASMALLNLLSDSHSPVTPPLNLLPACETSSVKPASGLADPPPPPHVPLGPTGKPESGRDWLIVFHILFANSAAPQTHLASGEGTT